MVLVFATLWFQVPFRGNFFTLLVFGLIYMISSLGLGNFSIHHCAVMPAGTFSPMVSAYLCFMFLSGFFLALENMPLWFSDSPMSIRSDISCSFYAKCF